jgi:hypothetical protein
MRLATEWRLIGHVLMPSSNVERKPLKKQEEEKRFKAGKGDREC